MEYLDFGNTYFLDPKYTGKQTVYIGTFKILIRACAHGATQK
jgi:hypothetical protein